MADGKIVIDISADADEFRRALDLIRQETKRTASGMSSALKSAGSSISGLGAAMTMGITTPMSVGAAAAGKWSYESVKAAEQVDIAFETMLGPERGRQMLEDLYDFAAETPFEVSGLTSATQKMLAYGFSAEDVIPLLTSVGDATAGLGAGQEGIDAVTRAMGQMQAKGKVMSEEMLQLTEAGIPAWQYLADAISGGDIPAAMEEVTYGFVDADTAIRALQDGMDRDFGGMMSKQASTLTGIVSNMGDAAYKAVAQIKDTEGYDELTDALGELSGEIGPFVESLMPMMEDGLSGAAEIARGAADAMREFAEMSEEDRRSLAGMAAAAAGAGPALTVLGGALRVVGTVGGGLGAVVSKAKDAIGGLGSKSSSAAGGVGRLFTVTGLLKGGLVGLGVGAVAIGMAKMADEAQKAAEHERLLADATMSLDEAAAAAAESLGGMAVGSEDALNRMAELNRSTSDTMAELQTDGALLDGYVATIERLADRTGLTASEQYELKNAVEQYNAVTGSSIEVIDAANGKLSASTDEINDNAQAWRDNAEAQAMQNIATEYMEEEIRLSNELAAAKEVQAQKEQALAEAREHMLEMPADQGRIDAMKKAQEEYDAATATVNELSAAYDTASANADRAATSAAVSASQINASLKDAVQSLPAEMQEYGLNIAAQLSAGIGSGSVSVDEAAAFMANTVDAQLASLPESVRPRGAAAAAALAEGVSSGQVSAQQAADVLNAVVSGEAASLPAELQPLAAQAANAFAGGIGFGEAPTYESAQKVAAAAAAMDDTGDMYTSGSHLAQQFAAGISAGIEAAKAAARTVADSVASILHFSVPDEGPWSGSEKGGYTSGRHLAQNFAAGFSASAPEIEHAALSAMERAYSIIGGDASYRRLPYAFIRRESAVAADGAGFDAMCARIDAMADRLERAIERPSELRANKRELGRLIKEASNA